MNIVEIWTRDNDGAIRHIFTPTSRGTPEAGTTRAARFDSIAYPIHYNRINSLGQFIRFIDGALVLDDPVLGTSVVADSAWIAAREAEVAAGEFATTQVTVARDNLQQLMTGLQGLSAADKGYAIYIRLLALRNGATPQVIAGIADRVTAAAYVQSTTQWTNTPAATKPMIQLMLETNAALCQVLLLVLSG